MLGLGQDASNHLEQRGNTDCHSIPDARDGKLLGLVARYKFIFCKAYIAEPTATLDHVLLADSVQ